MAEEERKNPLALFSAVLVVLAALGVFVYTNIPLKGLRPPIQEVYEPPPKVRARLWQDPFLAVMEHAKTIGLTKAVPAGFCSLSDPSNSETPDSLLREDFQRRAKHRNIKVLGVMVSAGPYAEDMEWRIRTRYAVLAGLDAASFKPEDSKHLSFTGIGENKASRPRQVALTNILPYEWLKKCDCDEFLLLLWLNDDLFKKIQKTPCQKLANLTEFIDLHYRQCPRLSFKIIGPADSENLIEMIKAPSEAGIKNIEIFSPFATVAEWILFSDLKGRPQPIHITRTVSTDEDLAEILILELKNRGLDILAEEKNQGEPDQHRHQDHLVLVTEWDTFYGRALPRTFKQILTERLGEDNEVLRDWVHEFTYLRGLDGKVPGEKERDGKEKQKEQSERSAGEDLLSAEEPAGKTQYDYLRRLADYLHRLEQHLHREGKGTIGAIGVLGSDFYDKYLILQALGQRYPDTIFFTTDLDARLVHPSYNKWTRNLLVASAFDLQLRQDLQKSTPPFRGSYQTSAFWATLSAFRAGLRIEDFFYPPRPRLFEIGRYHAIDITPEDRRQVRSTPGAGATSQERNSDNDPVNRGYPTPSDISPQLKWPFFLVFPIAVVLLLFISNHWFSRTMGRLGRSCLDHPERVLVAVPILILLVFLAYFCITEPAGEPFSWSEGISIWPAIILRLAAAALSLIFLDLARRRLEDNRQKICKTYHLPNSSDAGSRKVGDLTNSRLRRWLDRISYNWGFQVSGHQICLNGLWQEYLRRQSKSYRLPRLLLFLFFYLLVCVSVIYYDPPKSPVRGPWSQGLNIATLVLCVPAFLILTLYIFDATKLCARFVSLTLKCKPSFSAKTLKSVDLNLSLPHHLDEGMGFWILVRLIASHTEVVGNLIFYPFIVWFLIFASRLHYFDNWHTHLGLALVISLGAVYAWCSAFMLRRSTEKVRKHALAQVSAEVMTASIPGTASPEQRQFLDAVLKEIETTRRGAFASYLQNPVIQTLLVPFGGIGGLHLLDLLSKMKG